MKPVKQVLEDKGYDVWSIGPEASVFDAITLMSEKEIGVLLVFEGEQLVGIISERDYTRKVILKGRSSKETPVRAIMTSPVICTGADKPIEGCMALMTAKNFRHLPVLENDQVIGVVSLGDLVKAVIAEQKSQIEGLESYILYHDSMPL